jgi:hypothetical protein
VPTALTGMPFEKGHPPYQHFKLLVDLRNDLIHYKPQEKTVLVDPAKGTLRSTCAPILRKLEPLQILANHPAEARHPRPAAGETPREVDVSWLWRISTRGTARWACNTAAAMVHAVKEMVPIGRFSFLLEGPVRVFQTIP